MNNKNYQVEKLCGFYVSDWHLTTTILPYINSKIDEKTKVITILENNIEENSESLENPKNGDILFFGISILSVAIVVYVISSKIFQNIKMG